MEELEAIFHELSEAIKTGDVSSGVSALKAFFHTCEMEPENDGMAEGGEVPAGTGYDWQLGDLNSDDDNAQEEEAEYFGERY